MLPSLKAEEEHSKLTRMGLYERFVENWFNRSQERLARIPLKPKEQQAFEDLDDEFTLHGLEYSQNLALAMYEEQLVSVMYSEAKDGKKGGWRAQYLGDAEEKTRLLRFNAPLIRQGDQYRFIHKSIQDYLVARGIWQEVEESAGGNAGEPVNTMKTVQALWKALNDSDRVDPEGLLNRFNLVEDAGVQRFLVERVQQNKALVKPLLAWLKGSTQTDFVSRGAANAVTILVKAGVPFTGWDLNRIRIPGADLSYGVFDSAELQGADLRKVNLRKSWLRQANLSEAKMEGVQFGEWPYIQEESRVYSSVYSPDGKTCAIGLENGKISVYGTSNWEKLRTLEGHTNGVYSVAYSLRGDQIASGSGDKTVRLWDIESGEQKQKLEGHTDVVWSVAYSPRGDQLASGSFDNTVRLWDIESGEQKQTLEGHTNRVYSVAYSPRGDQVASGGRDTTVRLWDIESGEQKQKLEGHTDGVVSVAYSPRGDQVASGSEDNTVRLWDIESGEQKQKLEGHTDGVLSVAYSPRGDQVASGGGDTTVRLWDIESGEQKQNLEGHTHGVFSVAYSPRGDQVASGSWDNTVRLWDPQTGECQILIEDSGRIASLAWKEASGIHYLGIGSLDNSVRQWELRKEEGKYKAYFSWSTGHNFLTVRGALIEGVEGLSERNEKLLKQRGAIVDEDLWETSSEEESVVEKINKQGKKKIVFRERQIMQRTILKKGLNKARMYARSGAG
ncbi:hypothetical protein GCM10007934_12250 [Mycoavidus cysteinexigens]|nr:hypothetical protein GCM10007934_12250 [Mycoavidus cysteinexigens]